MGEMCAVLACGVRVTPLADRARNIQPLKMRAAAAQHVYP